MSPDDSADIRRLVYASVPVSRNRRTDLDTILAQARRNNGVNGVSGLLVSGGDRYVQVLEGTPEAVDHIMDVIRDDDRHTDVQVLSDEPAAERAFGGWTMANLPGGKDEPSVRRHLRELLREAPAPVKDAFAILG
jgi:hypothetical protein